CVRDGYGGGLDTW
nr:immunoglobulin heavy chain junction region [Macaca mulatta]MOY18356.1 immunoglobulin heavy chain junction region [Macaca mulatta]MOY18463.1 immunoglobulin heavy chain junction region [Macaca mulatta]MOY18507.1 immunoglobulin heavy chain junction region [Macaca mulatta]MOY18561.1 immunoglobulin heavy chain junction region [Macaca mulatta]